MKTITITCKRSKWQDIHSALSDFLTQFHHDAHVQFVEPKPPESTSITLYCTDLDVREEQALRHQIAQCEPPELHQ